MCTRSWTPFVNSYPPYLVKVHYRPSVGIPLSGLLSDSAIGAINLSNESINNTNSMICM